MEREALLAVLDPRVLGEIDEAAGGGDELAGEEGAVELVERAVDGDGGVTTDAPAHADGEGFAELLLVELVDRGLGGAGRLVDARRGAAEQRGVRGTVVVLVEEGPEADVEVVERGEGPREVQAALAEGAPEAFMRSSA